MSPIKKLSWKALVVAALFILVSLEGFMVAAKITGVDDDNEEIKARSRFANPIAYDDDVKPILDLYDALNEEKKLLDERKKNMAERERKLAEVEAEVKKEIESLKAAREDLVAAVADHESQEEAALKKLARMYEAMSPEEAAKVFNGMEPVLSRSLIERMSPRKSGKIIALVDVRVARRITRDVADKYSFPPMGD